MITPDNLLEAPDNILVTLWNDLEPYRIPLGNFWKSHQSRLQNPLGRWLKSYFDTYIERFGSPNRMVLN